MGIVLHRLTQDLLCEIRQALQAVGPRVTLHSYLRLNKDVFFDQRCSFNVQQTTTTMVTTILNMTM